MQLKFQRIAVPSEQYDRSLQLRNNILRIPLGLSIFDEDLEIEKKHIHIAGFDGEELVCILILLNPPPTAKMRQVAVSENYQGKGIGKLLVQYAEYWLKENSYTDVYCHARDVAMPFYLAMNYEIIGDPFTEVGIKHYKMRKVLK